jgi:hypothetical protein
MDAGTSALYFCALAGIALTMSTNTAAAEMSLEG